jgi:hypothetical protein
MADVVLPDDRAALDALLAGASCAAAAESESQAGSCLSSDAFVRVRHAARGGTHEPVEVKACGDGTFVYCTLLDARVPARLEGLLPDFLLSTSHDLRTPVCSIQSASTLLAALPAVAADAEARALLQAIDAACAVLLRVASNVLRLRQLQRHGALQLAPRTCVDPAACVRRAVSVVCHFLGDPPRVAWTDAPLPARVLADADALEACLQSMLLATVRLGAWLPSHHVVRLRVAAEPLQPTMQLHVTTELASPRATEASAHAFVLLVSAETPGRALTRDECERMMSPCGMAPADKGGGTGLALYVARGLVRAMGGELEVVAEREAGTLVNARIPLCVAEASMMPPLMEQAPPPAEAAAAAALPQHAEEEEAPQPPADTPSCTCAAPLLVDERELTARMVQCILANSDDMLAICRISAPPDAPLCVRLAYVSPCVERGRVFCHRVEVGQSLLEVAHPDDRGALHDAIGAAFRGKGPGPCGGHHLLCVHRSITTGGDSIWCQTAGVCDGDLLYLVCRACPSAAVVRLRLLPACVLSSHMPRAAQATCARARAWRWRCAHSRSPPRTTCASAATPCSSRPRCWSAAPASRRCCRRRRARRHACWPRATRPPPARRSWMQRSWCRALPQRYVRVAAACAALRMAACTC